MIIDKKKIKLQAKNLEPVVRIGKNGISENSLKEIITQLKKKKMIKVKLLKSFFKDKNLKEMAEDIALKTESAVIDVIGHVFVLYKAPKQKNI